MADDSDLSGESFAQGLGTGFLTLWQSVGNNAQSSANYNNAVSSQISANADMTDDALFIQADAQKAQRRMIAIIFIVIAVVPIAILLLMKKKN